MGVSHLPKNLIQVALFHPQKRNNNSAQQAFEQCYNLLTTAFPSDLPGRLALVAKVQKEGGSLPDAWRSLVEDGENEGKRCGRENVKISIHATGWCFGVFYFPIYWG